MQDEDFDSLASERRIDVRCDEFQRALSNGQSPRIENFLVGVTPLDCRRLLKELIGLEVDFRFVQHEQPVVSDYAQRFPSLPAEQIASILDSSKVGSVQSTVSFSHNDDSSGQRKRIGEHELIGRKLHIYQCVSLLGAGAMGQWPGSMALSPCNAKSPNPGQVRSILARGLRSSLPKSAVSKSSWPPLTSNSRSLQPRGASRRHTADTPSINDAVGAPNTDDPVPLTISEERPNAVSFTNSRREVLPVSVCPFIVKSSC